MKRTIKIAGIVIAVLIVIVLGFFLIINSRGIPAYEKAEISYTADMSEASINQGNKLASMLCVNCHMNRETGKLTGQRMMDIPQEFGTIYAPNITKDEEYGIGSWSDADIVYLLRTGIKKNGIYAPIYMPKFPHMADKDVNAIISFFNSDNPQVTAAPVPDIPSEPSFLTKFLCHVAFKPLPFPEEEIPLPDTSNKTELGRYMAVNLDCYACHSADFTKLNIMEPEKSEGYFSGGNEPLNREGKVILTPNLTPHKETGIGTWSEERFVKAVKYAFMENEPALRYPMMPYPNLTDKEAGAIHAYLMTIPPIENKVERSEFEN